ncbi:MULTISPECIES: hypothetical protein [unclassified Ruegeria]|uniref:COG3904 family protein n=1 Tax=unclassified Ruegeria TaxID=2625375 RepID=UPI0014890A70|nr:MULTISPECIES: hypothetical protein [unclassified Ruegeria]
MKKFLTTTALLALAGAAHAEIQTITLHSYKHWTVVYNFDENDGWNNCAMQVKGDGLSLSLIVDGNENASLHLYDEKADYSSWTDGSKFQLEIDNYGRWDMQADGYGNSLFVDLDYVADKDDVDRLLYEIRQGLRLSIYEYGEKEEFYWFSLHGSKAAANAIVENCLDNLRPYTLAEPEPEPEPEPKKAPVPGMDNPVPGLSNTQYELRKEETSVGTVMYFTGTISEGFAEDVKSYGDFDYFVIEESNGGLLGEAIEAGAYLRQNFVATSLDGACASACVELYAGGVKRYYSENARFGVHAMSVDGDEMSLSTTQNLLSLRVKHFEASGVDSKIVIDSLDTPTEEIRWLTTSQARVYGLIK